MKPIYIASIISFLLQAISIFPSNTQEFQADVEPLCLSGYMDIKIKVNSSYYGVVYPQGHRRAPCMARGNGRPTLTLRIPLISNETNENFCGVRINRTTSEKFVNLFVRFHEMLELANDKMYQIRCGLAGYTSKNETNYVDFSVLDSSYRPSSTAIFDRKYILRGKILGPDRTHVMRVRKCFAFDEGNVSLALTDEQGCPMDTAVGRFVYNDSLGTADAVIDRMFKFQESNRVNFQCNVFICPAPCKEDIACPSQSDPRFGRRIDGPEFRQSIRDSSKGNHLQGGTSVFVVPPGSLDANVECEYYPPWLWILCIALAVLFIIMMIINIFLCSAMTCSCTKTEVIEKEPSIIDEYDPYRSWHGSPYGSRYSLNGKGYPSAPSTMNSARSVSSHSDHYAIVHSRPDSRYSGH